MTLAAKAKDMAGNHLQLHDFAWTDRPEDSQDWCLVYYGQRGADHKQRRRAAAAARHLSKFGEDQVVPQHHRHWAVGWIEGYAIRVYDKDRNITEAFKAWYEFDRRLKPLS